MLNRLDLTMELKRKYQAGLNREELMQLISEKDGFERKLLLFYLRCCAHLNVFSGVCELFLKKAKDETGEILVKRYNGELQFINVEAYYNERKQLHSHSFLLKQMLFLEFFNEHDDFWAFTRSFRDLNGHVETSNLGHPLQLITKYKVQLPEEKWIRKHDSFFVHSNIFSMKMAKGVSDGLQIAV